MLRSRVSKRPNFHQLLVAGALVLLALPGAAVGDGGDLDVLLARLDARFDIYRLAEGYAVRIIGSDAPQADALLEVRGGTVARDGVALTETALDALVGSDARRDLLALAAATAGSSAQVDTVLEAPDPPVAERPERAPEQIEPAARESSERQRASRRRTERERAKRERERADETRHRSWGDGSRVRVLGSVHVNAGERVTEAMAMAGSVTVRGSVRRDVVAIAGSVDIDSAVGGDVTAVAGSIRLGPNARVEGDVLAIGGQVRRARGARVAGRVREIDPGSVFRGLVPDAPHFRPGWPHAHGGGFWDRISKAMLLIIATLALALLASQRMERLTACITRTPLRVGGVGVATQLATIPLLVAVTIVLIVSIIGIPALLLLLPAAVLALTAASIVGYSAVAISCGRWVSDFLGRTGDGPLVISVLGVLSIQGLSLAGELLDGLFGPFRLLGVLLLAVGFLIRYSAWTLGLGGVVLSLLGRRRLSRET